MGTTNSGLDVRNQNLRQILTDIVISAYADQGNAFVQVGVDFEQIFDLFGPDIRPLLRKGVHQIPANDEESFNGRMQNDELVNANVIRIYAYF